MRIREFFFTLDPGWKNLDPGSDINITDPQHCLIYNMCAQLPRFVVGWNICTYTVTVGCKVCTVYMIGIGKIM